MSRLTRRELFEQSLLASAAAAVAAQSIPAGAAAQAPARTGPNETLRIAVIGVRGRGMDHIRSFARMPDVQVAAICDCDLNVTAPAVKAVVDAGDPEPTVVQDLRRIMDDKSIDAVSIATTNHWHALAAIWAMQAGKDVYVEKPVSHNVREGRILVDFARKYRRICQAGTQCRSMKGTIDAIRFVHEGKLGRIKIARGLCYKPRPSLGIKDPGTVPAGVDYDLWIGPAKMEPFHQNRFHYNWHWRWNTGNGDLGNQGIHQMDLARWALRKQELPKSVLGFGGRLGYVDDGETYNTHVCLFDYGDSQLVFETRGLPTKDYRGARVGNVFHCENGWVVLTSYTGSAAFDNSGTMITTFNGAGDHYRNFVDAVRSRKVEDLAGDILEGHLSSALCHLGNISTWVGSQVSFGQVPSLIAGDEAAEDAFERYQTHLAENKVDMQSSTYMLGKRLSIDPRREQFTNDRAANRHLFREYRAPYVVPSKA